ncbi:MAG: type IV secretory system conjugative DNA transfer family protein [Clostridia bacterium]|nr:type IV secretory system conjugative DNA transfer family protein [Clostridia bacterium]
MIILGENACFENGYVDNTNTMLIGAPGTGKTRSYVLPNLMSTEEESIVVLDPKGEIYDITANLMREKGYDVRSLDFVNPEDSDIHYNPINYCRNEDDILKFTRIIVDEQKQRTADNFWPLTAQILCNAFVGFLKEFRTEKDHTFTAIRKLLAAATVSEDNPDKNPSKVDKIFEEAKIKNPDSWACGQYSIVRNAAGRTQKSVIISLAAEFCGLLTPQIAELTSYDDVNIPSFCQNKTIIYVKCSDSDRSKDKLIAMFFTQLFQELYQIADSSKSHSLPRGVKVILDDMGANLNIPNLDGIISTARGRRISISIILQSIGQLKRQYPDYTSIVNSCNNVVFLGGSDLETCKEMAQRLNRPLDTVLYKDMKTIFVFRQGEKPIITKVYNLKSHPNYAKLNNPYANDGAEAQKEEMLI